MVAECLGVLTTMLPTEILPVLLQLCHDADDKLSRRMIAHALRFSLSRSAASPTALVAITGEMHRFLPLLQVHSICSIVARCMLLLCCVT